MLLFADNNNKKGVVVSVITLNHRIQQFDLVCKTVRSKGVYARYSWSVRQLSSMLNIDDPAALNEIMLYLGRLSFIKDLDGRYQWCAPEYAKLLDPDNATDMIGGYDGDFIWSQQACDAFAQTFDQVLARQTPLTNKSLIDFPDGTERSMCTRMFPLYDEVVDVIGIVGVAVEVVPTTVPYGELEEEEHCQAV